MLEAKDFSVDMLRERLAIAGNLSWMLWEQQLPIYNAIRNMPGNIDEFVVLCARQFGKCVRYDVLVATPLGPVAIKDLVAGQEIYGYTSKGTVEPCRVVAKANVGVKRVVDLMNHGRVVATLTAEHRSLARWKDNKNAPEREAVLTTEQILGGRSRKIARAMVDAPLGSETCVHAYVIGAMIGNGCREPNRNGLWISCPDNTIPIKVAELLKTPFVYRSHETNYTWAISTKNDGTVSEKIRFKYDEWFKDRYSHEKYLDRDVIKEWDRESCLKLLAGLTDTDGSVVLQKDNTLRWAYSTGSKQLAEDAQWLVYRLFGREPGITSHNRRDVMEYTVHVINNFHAARIVKQISPFMVMDHKRWLHEYEQLNNHNTLEDRIGVTRGLEYEVECYDIQIDNDTSLYVLHNEGIITHNSHVATLMAVEDAIRYRDRCILIIGPDTKQTKEIVNPRMRRIQSLLPEGLLVQSKAENKWILYHERNRHQKNFSEIVIGGMNENSSSQRGKTVQNIYLEESGLARADDYTESLRSDLGPALTHSKNGKIIHLTTPPKVPDHPFNLETWTVAEMNGSIVTFTIYDNKKLTPAQFEACVRRSGGEHTDDFKREYLCQRIRDASLVVVPSFDEKRNVTKYVVPSFTKWNIMVDWGGVRDYTVGLLYTYDYVRNKLLFHKEFLYKENTPTNIIWPKIKEWMTEFHVELDRVRADAPGQTLVDLAILAKAEAIALPSKDDWQAGLNNLNMKCGVGQIEISAECAFTIQSLRSGTFNKNRTDFERTKALGHCDAIASMMYAIRHYDMDNPYPHSDGYGQNQFRPRTEGDAPLTGIVGRSFL